MKFHNMEKEKPECDKPILIKLSDEYVKEENSPTYYVVKKPDDYMENEDYDWYGVPCYVEAYCEGYFTFPENKIQGWCYLDEIKYEEVNENV